MMNQYVEIAKANDLWGFYSYTSTQPGEVCQWIDENGEEGKEFLKKGRLVWAKTNKKIVGLNTKTRNIQPGFSIVYHPVSSSNPFKPFPHYHSIMLPCVADHKSGKVYKLNRRIDHQRVKDVQKYYYDRLLTRFGLKHFIKPAYTVHLKYVELCHPSSVGHSFKYTNRSQVQDILRTIVRAADDFTHFVTVRRDKQKKGWIPCIKSNDQILDALDYVMNGMGQTRVPYGFMRLLKKYSDLLNIERDHYEDDDNWECLYPTVYRRDAGARFDKESGKVKSYVNVFYKKRGSDEAWRKIKPDELRGEKACMVNRKLYKARG